MHTGDDLKVELCDEFRPGPHRREQIRALLAECFVEAEFTAHRTYLKQIPARRFLAAKDDRLVGHLALDHRVIGTAEGPAEVFGVIDVCVAKPDRGCGIASRLLRLTEALARDHQVDFLILFAADPRLYERHGYQRQRNTLRWLKIHEHRTIGIGEEPIEELMVRIVGSRPWPEGTVDLLGHQA